VRLTSHQRKGILRIIREHLGDDVAVWLYGSRTADDRRGGDVDLLVRSPAIVDARVQAILHDRLERELSLPVDISFIDPQRGMSRFQRIAAATAIPVEAAP
jgi:predicted nucleotidyltransferase